MVKSKFEHPNFKIGISICTLGSIAIAISAFLLTSPIVEYSFPSWSTQQNGEIQIHFLPLPFFFMNSGLLLILSGIVFIYQSYYFSENNKVKTIAEWIFLIGIFLMFIAVIIGLTIFIKNPFVITTPQQTFGHLFN